MVCLAVPGSPCGPAPDLPSLPRRLFIAASGRGFRGHGGLMEIQARLVIGVLDGTRGRYKGITVR